MKTKITIFTLIILAACAPLSEQLVDKTGNERNAYLLEKCEDEAWRGHDIGSHHHYGYRPENEVHEANMIRICKDLTKPSTKKAELVKQCKEEAGKGTYAGKYVFQKHVNNLTEICDAFGETK